MAEWFRRKSEKIKTINRREITDGTWLKCPKCHEYVYKKMLEKNKFMCNSCNHHFMISCEEYINILFNDSDIYEEIYQNIKSNDPLEFSAKKNYKDQIVEAQTKTGNNEAIVTVKGKIENLNVVICIMNFSFIGGSLGSAVGEKISRAIDTAIKSNSCLIIFTSSGGARMQEGAISLMQLAKVSTKLSKFSNLGGLYITVLTNPTTGGTTASFGMQGDIVLAEPEALIGFAGARVIKQTIGEDLPEDFQKSEFLLKNGFIDNIVNRDEIRNSTLVANPGCYPTAAILALAPAVHEGIIEKSIIIDAKSGISGAGRGLSLTTHFSEVNENVSAYAVTGHRHLPEITQELTKAGSGFEPEIMFLPHLIPMTRGILSSCYATLTGDFLSSGEKGLEDVRALYRDFYRDEPFVKVVESSPMTKHTLGNNTCVIYPTVDARTNRLLVISCLDNLVRGAAGQAIQNMNIMLGIREQEGLEQLALYP